MVEGSSETLREVTSSGFCKEGQEQTGSGGGDAIRMSCEGIADLRESILDTKKFENILQNETSSSYGYQSRN